MEPTAGPTTCPPSALPLAFLAARGAQQWLWWPSESPARVEKGRAGRREERGLQSGYGKDAQMGGTLLGRKGGTTGEGGELVGQIGEGAYDHLAS